MNLTEAEYQLKYYFLIDPDDVATKVENEINRSCTDGNESLCLSSKEGMKTIFKSIFECAEEYTKFIATDTSSFFWRSFIKEHRNSNNDILTTLSIEAARLYKILMLNTITFGFFCTASKNENNLESSRESNKKNKKPLILSAKYDEEIKKGFFQTKYASESQKKEETVSYYKNDRLPQSYYSYFKRYDENFNKHQYSSEVLQSFIISDSKNENKNEKSDTNHKRKPKRELTPPSYLAYVCRHILVETAHAKFSSKIVKSDNLIKSYQTLCDILNSDYELLSEKDRLLTKAATNIIYGCDFFNSLPSLLAEINNAENNPLTQSLNDLAGGPIEMLIVKAMNLPLYFGRYSFLNHLCNVFKYSPNMESAYLQTDTNIVVTYVNKRTPPKSQLVNDGHALLNQYFNILGGITIPVIYSLWVVVVEKLNKNYSHPIFNKKTYIETLVSIYQDVINPCHTPEKIEPEISLQISSSLKRYCSATAFSKLRHFYLCPYFKAYKKTTPLSNTIEEQPINGNENSKPADEAHMKHYNYEHRILLTNHLSERKCTYLLDNSFYD